MPDMLTPQLRQAFLQDIEASRSIQKLYVRTFADAVEEAAEQVQDIRISELENPYVAAQPAALDFLVSLALGHLGGLILAGVTSKYLTAIVRTRALGARSPSVQPADVVLETAVAAAQKLRVKDGDSASSQSWTFGLYKDFAKETIGLGAVSAQQAIFARPATASPVRLGGADDTPGVALRDLAKQFLRHQEMATDVAHDSIVGAALAERLSVATATAVRSLLADSLGAPAEAWKQSLAIVNLKTRYRRLFEAMIWVGVFGGAKNIAGTTKRTLPRRVRAELPDSVARYYEGPRTQFKLTPKMTSYFLNRFLHPKSAAGLSFAEYHARAESTQTPTARRDRTIGELATGRRTPSSLERAKRDLMLWLEDINARLGRQSPAPIAGSVRAKS